MELSFSQLIGELLDGAESISQGTKGIDYLVIYDDDMKGYETGPLEESFVKTAEAIIEFVGNESEPISMTVEQIRDILRRLIFVQPAVDAYRARMWQYATDWGSEVSPIGNCTRELVYAFQKVFNQIPTKERKKAFKKLSKEEKRKRIHLIWWTSGDRHNDRYTPVENILFDD